MSRFNLAHIARARAKKRGRKTFRPITPTSAQASDLAAIYMAFVRAWSDVIEKLVAEYELTLTTTRDSQTEKLGQKPEISAPLRYDSTPKELGLCDSAADLGRVIDGAETGLLRLFLNLDPRLRSWALRVEAWHRDKWAGAALSASGIDLSTMLTAGDVTETVETVIARNVALVRNVSDQVRARISDIVYRGVQQRTPARDVAKELRESVAMSRRRALNTASDQASKLTSDLDTERMKQAGVEKWEWRSSHKLHFRPEHAARDGKVYTWKTAPNDLPGQLPFCGCRKLAVIDFDEG